MRAVKMVSGLQERDYVGRLQELQLLTLTERRHQADMLMVYKIVNGIGGIELNTWFVAAQEGGRATRATADSLNVKIKSGRLELRRNFFSVRASGLWNEVPAQIKRALSTEAFKRAYKAYRATMVHAA